ncbi:MAG: G5 domain-containing protein [Anaerolineales bacterium]|nr:G5 domain-containing protein [Anaerolineales bacterium]
MKSLRWLAFSFSLALFACQPSFPSTVTVLDGDQIHVIKSSERIPLSLLSQAGVIPQPFDRVLFNGTLLPLDQALPDADFAQLQLRRAMPLTVNSPQGQEIINSSAFTVGQALSEAGYPLTAGDLIDPPANTAITTPLTIQITPARDLSIFVDNTMIQIRSSAGTVGEALAEAGIPLTGLDISSPLENEALPVDGQIRIVRVGESINVALEPIPFSTERIESEDIPLGQEDLIQPGVDGLAMVRTRIRYEDGVEVSRKAEDRTVIREPQKRIVAGGSQIVLAPVGGNIPNEYWKAYQMYATVYSPCASGTGGCSYGTASGARAGYGIVAVDYSIYSYLAGMKVYIPGYGMATIGDTGGGPIIETALGVQRTQWIDLGFDEGGMVDMTGWVTVYFLAPAPAEIPYFLK